MKMIKIMFLGMLIIVMGFNTTNAQIVEWKKRDIVSIGEPNISHNVKFGISSGMRMTNDPLEFGGSQRLHSISIGYSPLATRAVVFNTDVSYQRQIVWTTIYETWVDQLIKSRNRDFNTLQIRNSVDLDLFGIITMLKPVKEKFQVGSLGITSWRNSRLGWGATVITSLNHVYHPRTKTAALTVQYDEPIRISQKDLYFVDGGLDYVEYQYTNLQEVKHVFQFEIGARVGFGWYVGQARVPMGFLLEAGSGVSRNIGSYHEYTKTILLHPIDGEMTVDQSGIVQSHQRDNYTYFWNSVSFNIGFDVNRKPQKKYKNSSDEGCPTD